MRFEESSPCALPCSPPPLLSTAARRPDAGAGRHADRRPLARQGARDLRAGDRDPDRAGARPGARARRNISPEQFRAGGFTGVTIHPYEAARRQTAALIVRWPAARPSGQGDPVMAHMDVVEARREDWSREPFTLGEKDGYFYGRGTSDIKQGITAVTTALLRLRAEGFKPGATSSSCSPATRRPTATAPSSAPTEWRDIDRRSNSRSTPTAAAAASADGTPLGFGIQTAEKTYQIFTLPRQPGRPQLAAAPRQRHLRARPRARAARGYRFEPMLNETTRAYFAPSRENSRAGRSATRCAAGSPIPPTARRPTSSRPPSRGRPDPHPLRRHPARGRPCRQCAAAARPGHGQLPDHAGRRPGHRAGDSARARRARQCRGRADRRRPARPTPRRCATTWSRAYTAAVHARHPGAAIMPDMSTGATDGLYFRVARRPGLRRRRHLGVIPGRRARPRPRRAASGQRLYDDVDHWTDLIRRLAR